MNMQPIAFTRAWEIIQEKKSEPKHKLAQCNLGEAAEIHSSDGKIC